MSEAKSTERPTTAEPNTDQADAESLHVSPNEVTSESANARSARGTGGTTARAVVAARLSPDELAALDVLREQFGGSRSDALRAAVTTVSETLSSGHIDTLDKRLAKAVAIRQPRVVQADSALLAKLHDAMRDVADRYSQQTFQLQKIGNNWNQLVKIANAGEQVDADALRGIGRSLERLTDAMEADAKRDAKISIKFREAI